MSQYSITPIGAPDLPFLTDIGFSGWKQIALLLAAGWLVGEMLGRRRKK
jgi:hypothetical protein